MLTPAQTRVLANMRELGGRLECYTDGRWRFTAQGLRQTLIRGATVDALLHAGDLADANNAVAIERTLVPREPS